MSWEIVPFEAAMLPEAGELLAARYKQLRIARPELPAKFEDPDAARSAVEAAWNRDRTEGVAAFRDGQMRGYLMGDRVLDMLWGRSAWVRFAGCALAPGQDAELVRDLYAALGERWVQWGIFTHFALMPCDDTDLVGKWFALCFGIEQIHALLMLDSLDLSPRPLPSGVEIRRATPDDRAPLVDLSDIISRHQAKAPCWGIHLPETQVKRCKVWSDLAADAKWTFWLAFYRGKLAGYQGFCAAEHNDKTPIIPEQCVELGVAGTREWARGKGIGQALTRHGLAHARSEGYRVCLTDWRSTNLLSSRFWPRQGFQPVVYRLSRRIDDRIAWAGERE